jgi:hypothetical protein
MVIVTIGVILFWSAWAVWFGMSRLAGGRRRVSMRLLGAALLVIGVVGLRYGWHLLRAVLSA